MLKKLTKKYLFTNNKELLLGLIVGLILSSTAVYGVIKYASSNVFYRNTDSHLSATTVQSAIDELYGKCTTAPYTLTADSKGGIIPTTSGWNVNGSTATKTVIFKAGEGATINGNVQTTLVVGPSDEIVFPDKASVKKKGYKFDGVWTDAEGNPHQDITSLSAGSFSGNTIELTATHFTPIRYTVKYVAVNSDGGTNTPAGGPYTYETKFPIPTSNWTRKGYEFIGWDTDSAGLNAIYKPGQEVSGLCDGEDNSEISLFTVWKEKSYTYRFMYNGNLLGTKTAYYSTEVSLIPNPNVGENDKDLGYEYTDATGNTRLAGGLSTISVKNNNLPVDQATITLVSKVDKNYYVRNGNHYAHLIGNGGQFTRFDAAGVESKLDEVTIKVSTTSNTATFEIPVRTGYTFAGYQVDGRPINPMWTYVDVETKDVKATWKNNEYTVVFDANGGSGTMPSVKTMYDPPTAKIQKIGECRFEKSGYNFDGWELGTTTYNTGDNIINLTSEKDGIVTLKAKWTPKTFTVNYYGNGGTATGDMTTSTFTYGVDNRLKENKYTKANSEFIGWALATNSAVAYANNGIIAADAPYIANIDLYATWKSVTAEAVYGTFIINGNSGLVNNATSYTVKYLENEPVDTVSVFREGYHVDYWLRVLSTGEVQEEYPTTWTYGDATITFKPHWAPNKYKVVYHSNDENNGIVEDSDVEYGRSYTIKRGSAAFTRDNYTIATWTDATGVEYRADGTDVRSNLSSVDGGVVDLYANWVGVNYNITFNNWNPTLAFTDVNKNKSNTYTYGDGSKLLAAQTNSYVEGSIEYVFAGWATDSTNPQIKYYAEQSADDVFTKEHSNNNITLYSVWKPKKGAPIVVFYPYPVGSPAEKQTGSINGKPYLALTLSVGDTVPYPTASLMERQNYMFNNLWKDESGTEYDPNSALTVNWTGTKKLYAEWLENGQYFIRYNEAREDGTPRTDSYVANDDTLKLGGNSYNKLGYTFEGWSRSDKSSTVEYTTGTKAIDLNVKVGATLPLYPVWKAKTYTVEYYDQHDILIGSDRVLFNEEKQIMANPHVPSTAKDLGYTYTKRNGTILTLKGSDKFIIERDFDNINTDTTVIKLKADVYDNWYVIYGPHYARVFADAEGEVGKAGSGKFVHKDASGNVIERLDDITVYIASGSNTKNVFETPVKLGHKLTHWVANGNPLHDYWDYLDVETQNVYAAWAPITFNVKYNANGGSNVMEQDDVTYNDGTTLKANEFERYGYEFNGWKYDGRDYAVGVNISTISSIDGDDVTFVANWKPWTYTIIYDKNGADVVGTMEPETVDYDTNHTIRPNAFAKPGGYAFNGWSTSPDGDLAYGNEATILADEPFRRTITLYARWIRIQDMDIRITAKGNGGLIAGVPMLQAYYKLTDDIKEPTKVKDGYNFTYWTNTSNNIENYPVGTHTVKGNYDLTANWGIGNYNIRYVAKDTIGRTYTDIATTNEAYEIKSNTDLGWTRDYYTFAGWKTLGGTVYQPTNEVTNLTRIGDTVELEAIWTPATYKIRLTDYDRNA